MLDREGSQSGAVSRRFDELTRRAGRSRSRREVLGLFGRGAVGALVGGQALQFLDAPAVSAQDCLVEYPPADLDDCPNKRKHPGNVPKSNGCGQQGSSFRPPQGFGRVDFTPPCNEHDVCYGTCMASKATCDQNFGDQLVDRCIAGYSGAFLSEVACIFTAGVFQAAVTLFGGEAYEDGQKLDCECCRPIQKIWCNCNKKCYTDAVTCTSECKASLGCFTGICVPATTAQCP